MPGIRSEYFLLEDEEPSSSSEDIVTGSLGSGSNEPERRFHHLTSRFIRLAMVTVIVCTVVDLLVLLYFSVQFRLPVPPGSGHMELRSSYINLDVLYSKGNVNSSQHRPIVNHPLSVVQVSLTEPKKVLPTYHTGFSMQKFGPVPLVKRRLLVTPQISTVAQFRVIDFGMESCSLAVSVPRFNETDGQVMSAPAFILDVHTLPVQEKLNLHAVSYSSLPTTKSLFVRLVLSEGSLVQTPIFPCRTLSYHTFFLACSSPDCHLDLIGTLGGESGLFMYQYQTI